MDYALTELLSGQRSVLDVRKQRSLARAAQRLADDGMLTRLLPGIYCSADRAAELEVRITAAATHDPDAVISGRAAAAMLWWPELHVDTVDCLRRTHHAAPLGFRWLQRSLPDDLILQRGLVRVASPALAVLDLIPEMGGRPIDEALRRRVTTLTEIERALQLTGGRRGNAERRWLVGDSCDEPWSPAERCLHRIYRSLRLPLRYATNYRVMLGDRAAYLDLALPDLLLAFEVDGYSHHGSSGSFEYDRDRNSHLAARGWQLVNYSAFMVTRHEAVVSGRMCETIRARAALFGWPALGADLSRSAPARSGRG